jgi:hypothetical protein
VLLALTPADATVAVAALVLLGQLINGYWSRSAAKQMKPNGGSSMADAVNRTERKLDEHIDADVEVQHAIFSRLGRIEGALMGAGAQHPSLQPPTPPDEPR